MESKQEKNIPLVTIVTITYNLIERGREAFIRQCIESVHNQTYSSIEHIIIDGASSDGTYKLLKQYEDLNYITVYSESDQGIYDAMNKGISKANGKYINFLNSDDFFHNQEGVEISVKYLEENVVDYSFADAMLLAEDGKERVWKSDISKLLWAFHYCHQTMFVKTDILKSIGGFDTFYKISADTDMMIRLYAKGASYIRVPFCIVTYRVGGYSSQNEFQSRIDHSTAFYVHIGKNLGLSMNDCFLCWGQRFLEELPKKQQLELIYKVPTEYGAKHLLREFITRSHYSQETEFAIKRYLFLGFIPFLRIENSRNERKSWLFEVLILKTIVTSRKKKFYLFGFLPLLKVKFY